MLPNPVRTLFPHHESSNREAISYFLNVPPLINTRQKILCDNAPITLECSMLEIVRGNSKRARSILNSVGSTLTIEIALIDTHLLSQPLIIDLGYMCDRLESSRICKWFQMDAPICPIVEERGANPKRGSPRMVAITLLRTVTTD